MLTKCGKLVSELKLIFVIFCFILINGCAAGVTRVDITHDPLETIAEKKDGTILVRPFTDSRKDTAYIGNKRNGFGMVLGHIGTQDGVKLEVLLTKYFVDALKEAGYSAIIEKPDAQEDINKIKFDAIVEGKIAEFWLDLYMATRHYMTVNVKALDKDTQEVLWEKEISSDNKNILWLGVASEFEKVIRESLTKSLNQAAFEFASNDFYKSINK